MIYCLPPSRNELNLATLFPARCTSNTIGIGPLSFIFLIYRCNLEILFKWLILHLSSTIKDIVWMNFLCWNGWIQFKVKNYGSDQRWERQAGIILSCNPPHLKLLTNIYQILAKYGLNGERKVFETWDIVHRRILPKKVSRDCSIFFRWLLFSARDGTFLSISLDLNGLGKCCDAYKTFCLWYHSAWLSIVVNEKVYPNVLPAFAKDCTYNGD